MNKDQKHILLKNIPKKDPYQVPKEYFDSLPGRINQRIESLNMKPDPILTFNWKLVGFASAASIALLVALLIGLQQEPGDAVPEDLLADVSTADLIVYLESSEIETHEIMETLDAVNWSQADSVHLMDAQLNKEDLDLLYMRYGVSTD